KSDKAFHSVILEKLMWLTKKVYALMAFGFFGKLFTAYSAEEQLLYESRLFSRVRDLRGAECFAGAVKLRMARSFENSAILGAIERGPASLIYRKLKTYGAFLFSLGAYGVLAGTIKAFAFENTTPDTRTLFVNVAILVIALPLLTSRDTLSEALLRSRLLSPILFDWLGVSRDAFVKQRVYPKRYAAATALGMVLGVLTAFVDPLYYVAISVVLLGVLVIFRYPEIGVVAWIVAIPFVGFLNHATAVLGGIVGVTAASYLIKLIRGKRTFRMKLIDYPILLFATLYLLGGVFSKGGLASLGASLMYILFLCGHVLIFNLIRTREWVRRCVLAAVISGAMACVLGVFQIFTGSMNSSWLDNSLFSGIGTRIVSSFDNPNVFAEYLLLLIPFALACLLRQGRGRNRWIFAISLTWMLVCLVFTWSRGAWLGFLLGLLLFFVVFSKKTAVVLLGGVVTSPFWSLLVPSTVVDRFLSIGNLAESSASYRISAWYGVFELLSQTRWCGIGVGPAAFEAVYPSVALAGTQAIKHAHSIYLQLLTELGIAGLLVFLLIVFLFAQNCFEYLLRVNDREERGLVIAGISSVAAMLVMGITDHIWYDYRIFLLFWTVIGLVSSYIKYGFTEVRHYHDYENNTQYASSLDIGIEAL
ncbi:MAG: O-antigen ligase family protein, partial [Clostridia bacterium]|nr:O-antigen ligase family protein [Clostridia bacterium]